MDKNPGNLTNFYPMDIKVGTLDDKIFGKLPKKVADSEKVDIDIESAKK